MKTILSFLLLITLSVNTVFSQDIITVGNTELEVREVTSGLDVPWEMKWGPDGFLWITERDGLVSRINVDTGEKNVILDITNQVWQSSEAGLLGMEIHPEFNNGSPYVFLVYTYLSSGQKEKVVYYEYDANNDQLINETVLLGNIPANPTHSGSRLLILDDLTMLVTTGDVQDWMDSQNLDVLSGKTLRMSVDISGGTAGFIPSDNPIPNSYVWSWGHRNAQGLTLAPNGKIYSSEHGPSNDDELQILIPGGNYGWPNVQGYCDNQWVDYGYAEDLTNSYTEIDYCEDNDIIEAIWSSGSSTIATSDLIWYDNPAIPEFQNTLLMTVLKDKNLVRFALSEDGSQVESVTEFFNNEWGRLRDICVSPDGKIYLATNGYSWPSQPPNEIIELNPNFNNSFLNDDYFENIKVINSNGSYTITSSKCDFNLYDISGKIILEGNDVENIFFNSSDFSSGIYNLILKKDDQVKMIQLNF